MRNFDFSGTMALGQYEPGDSYLHRLVPGVKLLSAFLLVSVVLFSPLYPVLPLLFLFFAVLARAADLKIRYLMKGVKPVLPFLILIGIIQVFFISRDPLGEPLFVYRFLRIYPVDLYETAQLFARFFCLVLLLSLFNAVTPLTEISHGTEFLLRPLGKKSGAAHDMSLIVTITFRFIPILAQEAESITKAQAARGGEFGTWKTGFLRKVRLYVPLIVPLFIAALDRAEILVEAMESRCYTPGRHRTRLDEYHWQRRDTLAITGVGGLFLILLLLRLFQFPLPGLSPFFLQ